MKNILFSMLLALISVYTYSQNKIHGNITSSENMETLFGATVYFPELEIGTTTNENGNYLVNNLPNGNYKIIISYIGHTTYSSQITLFTDTELNLTLISSAIEMEEVILSTPFHKLQRDNVMKVERQNLTDLKAKGIVSLSEGISTISGVSSLSTGIGIGKPIIRGLSGNRVLVFAQGIRLENQQYGDEHGLGVNESGIESIEVIKGPASLLYGSDALGGVLYLNPERFTKNNTSQTDGEFKYFTNTQGINTTIGYKVSEENLKFLIRLATNSHADYKTGKNERVTNSRFRNYDLKTGVGYQYDKFKTELRYNYYKSELGLPEEIGMQTTHRKLLNPYQLIDNHILSSKTNVFFSNSSLEVTLGYIFNDRKEFEDPHEEHEEHGEHEDEEEEHDENAPALHMALKTFSYNVKWNLPEISKFETIIGVQGMHQTNTNMGEEVLIPNATTNDFGVFATAHNHLSDMHDLQIGVRYDFRSIDTKANGHDDEEHYIAAVTKNFNSFNGALGLKSNLSESFVSRINIASGFRAPNLAELTSNGAHEGTNRFEVGNANLKNEQNFQIDLSIEHKTSHLELFANGFYNKINNYIFLMPNGEFEDGDPIYLYQQDNAVLYGGELGFHFHPHPLDWLHFESAFETVIGKLKEDVYLPLMPANSLTNTFRVVFNTNKKVKKIHSFISLKSYFKQTNTSAFESNSNAYDLLNAGIGCSLHLGKKELNINLSGTNILDKQYVSHLSRLKSDNINNIGRNISLGLSLLL
ncbi:MAG: TonB-dependent receptor [Cellulophaga sp.]